MLYVKIGNNPIKFQCSNLNLIQAISAHYIENVFVCNDTKSTTSEHKPYKDKEAPERCCIRTLNKKLSGLIHLL